MDILKKLPDGEIIWEQIHDKDILGEGPLQFLVTSDKRREAYTLWRVHHDGITLYERMGKAKIPPDLWRKFGGVINSACGYVMEAGMKSD